MPDDDEWGDEWIREDEEWEDPRLEEPTVVGDAPEDLEDEPYDDEPYDDGPIGGPPAGAPPYDDGDDGYEDEPDPRRRGLLVATIAVLVLVVGIAVAALLVKAGDDSDSDVTADRSSTTTTVRTTLTSLGQLPGAATSSSTSTPADPNGPATGGSLGSSTSTTKRPATTTTTTDPEITNDPACVEGKPQGGDASNQPMRISFCVDDQAPKVGQPVQVIGTAVDKDAQIEPECIKVSWEGEELGTCPDLTVPGPDLVINRDFTFTHTFTAPGTYTIRVAASSDAPKSSAANTTYKITVHA